MDIPTLIIWLLALILVVVSFLRPGKVYVEGFRKALDYIITMFPRIFMALLVSGFFSVLIPTDVVASWIGKEAGLKGILVGSFLGGFTPGGPLISFPIAFVLLKTRSEKKLDFRILSDNMYNNFGSVMSLGHRKEGRLR